MNLSKLRALAKEARQKEKERQAAQAESARLFKEGIADQIIASLPQVVEYAARYGANSVEVYTLSTSEFVSEPKPKIFSKAGVVSPSCLPAYAKRIYDHCKREGLKTNVVGGGGQYSILVEW